MKKSVMLFLSAIFVLATVSFVNGDEVIKLKAANYLPTTHKMSLLGQKFCEEINKRTKGLAEVTYYPGGILLSPVKMITGINQGIADMGLSHIAYTRGRFPVTEVFDQPLGFPSGYVASHVSQDFYNKFKPKEWNDVHVLFLATSGPLVLHTVSKPVKTLEELKGLKIRATGRMSDVVKALGAVPIPVEMPDAYEALRRQVLDGIMVDLSPLKYWKFAEVEKYVTASWRLGTGYTFFWVMNLNKWNALPRDMQKIFTEVAAEIHDAQARLWNEMDLEGVDVFKKGGGQILNLSEAETAKWIKAVQPIMVDYKKDMVSKGFTDSEVDSWINYIKERINYWRNKEKTNGIAVPF